MSLPKSLVKFRLLYLRSVVLVQSRLKERKKGMTVIEAKCAWQRVNEDNLLIYKTRQHVSRMVSEDHLRIGDWTYLKQCLHRRLLQKQN
jgi:hypothetical protein